MGVWIETYIIEVIKATGKSHPVWVCGLKHMVVLNRAAPRGHTLYGCVD